MAGTSPRIGVIGLGRMGAAIARKLAQSGLATIGWTRSGRIPESIAPATGIPALLAQADIVILSLFDDAAVAEVAARLAEHDLTGKLIVDTSTVSPDTPRKAAPLLEGAGARLIDAPVSGGPEMIAAGSAGIFMGGEAADVARFAPVAALISRAVHVGALGDGAAAKIVNNMMINAYLQALKEAMLTGRRAGLSSDTMLAILEKSPIAAPFLASRLDILRGESDRVGFSIAGAVKDSAMFAATAQALGIDTPTIRAANRSFTEAAAAGLGEADAAVMVRAAVAGA